MNKPWKRRSVSSPAIDQNSMQAESHSHADNEGEESSVKVVASVLQHRLYNKTVPITMATTVDDIITHLVSEYAVLEEDKDPKSFYLMEVRGMLVLLVLL